MTSVFGRNSMQHHSVSQGLMSDMPAGMHPRVSILGSQFTLLDEGGQHYGAPCILRNTAQGQKMTMLAIIIGSNPKRSRIFYERDYDPVNPGPPDCFSDNGLAPSVDATNPQARTCLECEWSKWGSDISALTGKKIKACTEKRKIAILVVGDTTQRVYEMQVPPASQKYLAKYVALCAGHQPPGESRKADVCDFVTAISFVPGQVGVLDFEPFAWISSVYRDSNGTVMASLDARGQAVDAEDRGESVGQFIDEIWGRDDIPILLGLNDQPWTPPALSAPLPGMTGSSSPVQHAIASQPTTTVPGAPPYAPPPPPAQLPSPVIGSPFAPPAGREPAQPVSSFSSAQTPQASQAPQQQSRRGRKPRSEPAAAGGAAAHSQAPFLGGAAAAVAAATGQSPNITPAPSGGDIPDFLRRPSVPNDEGRSGGRVDVAAGPSLQPAERPSADRATNESGQFGMVNAAPPPTDLAKTLGGVFALPVARQ